MNIEIAHLHGMQRITSTSIDRVLITTVPFGEIDRMPLELLEQHGIEYVINPLGRKLKEDDLAAMISGFTAMIAGTEPITAKVMSRAPHLRFISRVGIGLDNVDLKAARERNILVSYTPEAPSDAVAELTLGFMISLLRFVPQADRALRIGTWKRFMGRRLSESTVGIIGVGRIGKRVTRLVSAFGARILANDLQPDFEFGQSHAIEWVDKETLYNDADIITLHVPLTSKTERLISGSELHMMKSDVILINTSRGNIIDEAALAHALQSGRIGGAAIDVFAEEPYSGELTKFDNCQLTCHMGSMSRDCRARMEREATEELIRFLKKQPLMQLVPEDEYAQALHAA